MEKSKIILASGSPRRKELLLQIGIVPEIIVSHVEEKITSDVPAEVVMSLAEQKAVDVAKEMPEGTVILGSDTVVSFYDETDVNVSPMTEKEIREYADSEEPMDKAGSYAVQGFFARYIDGLKGSYANVMGLPVHLVYQELKKLGAL